MRKQKKLSAYSQKRGASNVTDFIAEKSARSYRIEKIQTVEGSTLKLIIPHQEAAGGEKALDISYLLDFPLLSAPFAEALSTSFRLASTPLITAQGASRNLKNGFFQYLRAAAPNAALNDISSLLFNDFIKWLGRTENGKVKYKKISKQHFTNSFTVVIRYLQSSETWKDHLAPDLVIRKNIWREEVDDREQVEVIPEDTYSDIYIACTNEIRATMKKVRHHRALMEKYLDHPIATEVDINPEPSAPPKLGGAYSLYWAANPYKNLGLCLASLRHRVPRVILSITELKKMPNRRLLRVVEGQEPFGSIPGLYSCFYPYSRDLVPFILMLSIHLDYNPETLLKSLLGDYEIRSNEVGSLEIVASPANIKQEVEKRIENLKDFNKIEREILVRAKKGRANNKEQRQIRPATDDPDNPASIVKFLEEWTSFIRPFATPAARDRLLIFVTEQGVRSVRCFAGLATAGSDSAWRTGLKRFYKTHGLPHIPLNRFRTTGLDITDALFGGDIRAKQAAGNHASPETTYRLYSTNAQKQRGDEFLGQVSQLRKRWREAQGKIDPRNKPTGSDIGAATPGWTCADPYSGPYVHDRLCGSYGSCPACPNSSIALNDPYACAQAWNLLRAIDDAAAEIAPDAWLERWAPVKKKLLEVWLPSFPESIQTQARVIKLSKLPPLE